MELVELSGVNDTHYGWVRFPVRKNQVPPVAKVCSMIRRLEWDQQEAQNTPDPMESIRSWNKMKMNWKQKEN